MTGGIIRGHYWIGLLIGLLAVHDASGQQGGAQVRRTGQGTGRLDARLEEIIRSGRYRVLQRDTLIARNDTLRGPVFALGIRLVLEGTLIGDLATVDANVYIRPTARIEGDVFNAGSGLYRSELATITGVVEDYPLAPYHLEREGEAYVIVGDVRTSLFRPEFALPTADRVEGLRPRLGAAIVLPAMGRVRSELAGWAAYSFEREGWKESLQGGGELRLRRGFTHLTFGIDETVLTNDTWVRSDIKNSVSSLFNGKDYRNYYGADRQYITLARELVRGPHAALVSLRAQREDAKSLIAGDPWTLLDTDSIRTNPAIDDGVISSWNVGLNGAWTGIAAVAEYNGSVELADESLAGGQYEFGAFVLGAKWAMLALADHTLELEGHFQGPLPGTATLPRQRWATIGGSGTLYTFDVAQFRGDRLAYFESKYSIPLDRQIKLPFIGSPALQFLHIIGMAWTQDESRDLEQNIGVRLQFPFLYARVMMDPASQDLKFAANLTLPRTKYPWEKRAAPR